MNKKKGRFNLQLNALERNTAEPNKVNCSFVILDFDVSHNNVLVDEETALSFAPSVLNTPIVASYKPVSEANANDDDFGTHEEELTTDKYGKPIIITNTTPIGTFTSEGYVKELEIDGVTKRVLVADGVLWYARFKDACDLLIKWYNEGQKINMSCEYLYHNYKFVDGVEQHLSPILFDGHAILGSSVQGAYDSATLLEPIQNNDIAQFNKLVAQAINQVKEDENLEEKQTNEDLEVVPADVKVEVEPTDTNTEDDTELKSQKNELSLYDISDEIRKQVKAHVKDEEYLWVSDLYTSSAIVAVETEDSYKHYKYEYSLNGDAVTVDLENPVEVEEKREWITATNDLSSQVDTLTIQLNEAITSKDDLAEKFNSATETITSLNMKIEELKPLQEQMLNAKREEKLTAMNEKFAKAFNNAGAREQFESEEVKSLLNQAIEDSTEGKDALLALNTMIVELITNKELTDSPISPLISMNAKRENLIADTRDDFDLKFKI